MTHHGRENADEQLAVALASGLSVRRAAQQTGLSESTIYRRRKEADFLRLLAELRREMLDRALAHLAKGSTEAAAVLRKLLRSRSERIRLGAARVLLQTGMALREELELRQRLETLEQRLPTSTAEGPG